MIHNQLGVTAMLLRELAEDTSFTTANRVVSCAIADQDFKLRCRQFVLVTCDSQQIKP